MKWLWVVFGIWCAIVLFVPMVHILPLPSNTLALAKVLVGLPWIALALYWYLHKRPETFLKSLITIDIATGIAFAFILCLIGHLIVQNVKIEGIVWAHPNTLITVLLLILLLMRKYAHWVEESKAILLSLIVGAFAISAFEIPYLLTLPLIGLGKVPFMAWFYWLAIPFLMISFKLRPTKWTIMLLAIWAGLWCIWVLGMDRWDISSTLKGEPIQWIPYQLSKGIKLFVIPLLYSLNAKSSAPVVY